MQFYLPESPPVPSTHRGRLEGISRGYVTAVRSNHNA